MSAPYPYPTNVTGLASIGDYLNTITNGLWGVGISVVAMVIIFSILAQKYSTRTSVATTGVASAILAVLWRFAGQITDGVMFGFIMFGFFGIIYLYFTKDEFTE